MDSVNPASLPPEYWGLDPYANQDSSHHHSHPPQQQPTPQPPQQQPLGISWDHPVLHSQPPQRDQGHGLYQPPTPQSWQQNPLHHQPPMASPTPQELGIPAQYQQLPPYAQGQVTFDSRPSASDNSHYQSYSFNPNFYAPQHIAIPDAFSQSHSPQPPQQQSQPASYPPLHQNSLPQYAISPGFPEDPTVGNCQTFSPQVFN